MICLCNGHGLYFCYTVWTQYNSDYVFKGSASEIKPVPQISDSVHTCNCTSSPTSLLACFSFKFTVDTMAVDFSWGTLAFCWAALTARCCSCTTEHTYAVTLHFHQTLLGQRTMTRETEYVAWKGIMGREHTFEFEYMREKHYLENYGI